MIAFHASNIQKSYNKRLILDLDLHFEGAQLHVILGPNGSGKTSLLRLLAFLDKPDKGEILLSEAGKPLATSHMTRQRIVLAPHPAGLFNHTVQKNVAYGLKLRKIRKSQQFERIHEVLEAVGLWHLRQSNALSLSSGEKQRLCMAMAMVVKPEVILLDEPTSSLDPQNVKQVERIISKMKLQGQMVILVTHNISQAKRLADMVTFMAADSNCSQTTAADFFVTSQNNVVDGYL